MVAFRADTHECSNKIFAKEAAVVGRSNTLIYILAVAAIRSEGIAIGTDAAESASHVVTTEGTLVPQLLTLVNILTSLSVRRELDSLA